jgi:predicted MPP superfamily phosphohydrolase
LDVVDADRDDYKKAVANIDATAPQIVLSHTPDIILKNIASADLILSGHTHGGQIRLPGIGAIPEIPTFLGRQYDEGLFNLGDQQLFITRGVGESGTRARLFCPPEISILTIDL